MSDAARPLTTGWKIAIVLTLLIALGNSGVTALREREERRFQNHEKRIDDLENRIREMQRALDKIKDKAPDKSN